MNLQPAAANSEGRLAPAGLGHWNTYFIVKLVLYWQAVIGFHAAENLALALVLLIPLGPRGDRWRSVAVWPVAVALLYHDSWLPPISRAWAQAGQISSFSPAYLAELAGRFVSIQVVALIVVAASAYLLLARWLRFSVLVTATLAYLFVASVDRPDSPIPELPMTKDGFHGNPDVSLRQFHEREAGRQVSLPQASAGDAPFDIVFLHVCSLSWDDLQAMGLEGHRLFSRFDILFSRFNAVASYSGPAAIRLQRAACGQQPHAELYSPAPQACYLTEGLRRSGFEPALAMNHDGHFDDFLRFVQAQGGLDKVVPLGLDGLRVTQHSFDGSAVYDDAGVLGRWIESRKKMSPARVALYYNTVSLHDGNRLSGEQGGISSLDTYKTRLSRLLDDLDGFIQAIDQSGRPTVVVFVPEHGAAVRGDRLQIAGLREIPSPAITLVPVGVKISGHNARREGKSVRVDVPTSFLAVAELLRRLLAKSPFASDRFDPAGYAEDLPVTAFVAENEEVVLVQSEKGFSFRQGRGGWSDYPTAP